MDAYSSQLSGGVAQLKSAGGGHCLRHLHATVCVYIYIYKQLHMETNAWNIFQHIGVPAGWR